MRGREGEQGVGVLFIHAVEGGPAVERGGGEGRAARRHGDSAAVATVSMTLLRKPPCTVFLFLIFPFLLKPAALAIYLRHLSNFIKYGKIHIASLLRQEDVIKISAHLENMLCVNYFRIAHRHFGDPFKLF